MNYPCFNTLQLLLAFILDVTFGDPFWMPHPVRWIGRLIERLEDKLYPSPVISPRIARMRGLILVVLTVVICTGIAWGALSVTYMLWQPAGYILSVWIAFTTLACKSLHSETRKVIDFLNQGNLEKARDVLAFLVSRDTDALDSGGVSRTVLETLSENISDGIVAPFFYLALGGPILAILYKSVNTLDSMVGYKNDKYLHFGWFAAKLDDAFNFIPSRITAFLIVLVAWLYGKNWRGAYRVIKRDGRKLSSPNAGYPQAAIAGALDIQLGGPQRYFGNLVNKPFLGDNIKQINAGMYFEAVLISYGVSFLSLIFAGLVRYLLCSFS